MSRVPPSNRPPPASSFRTVKPKAPRHVEHKHELKQEELEENKGEHTNVSGEHAIKHKEHEETAMKHAEVMGWGAESHAEAEEKKAEREEKLAETQRDGEEDGKQREVKQPLKTTTAAKGTDQSKPGLHQPAAQKKDEFQKAPQQQVMQQKIAKPPISDLGLSTRIGASEAVSAVKTTDAVREAAERALKSGKPPDAFTLLNQAQPHGVFFKEDYERDGHTEDKEDPELRAAVEECIRQLFGVRGILRVGAGRNQADEAVIIVAVGQGFGESSLRAVPEKVNKFTTLLALPFEVLPLKKER